MVNFEFDSEICQEIPSGNAPAWGPVRYPDCFFHISVFLCPFNVSTHNLNREHEKLRGRMGLMKIHSGSEPLAKHDYISDLFCQHFRNNQDKDE